MKKNGMKSHSSNHDNFYVFGYSLVTEIKLIATVFLDNYSYIIPYPISRRKSTLPFKVGRVPFN